MPAPRISLDQWRALLAVVDEGAYAKAAKALHKSQSSVTYAVQKLESLLGVKAFKIQGRKANLTPTGELLYRRARYLLDEATGLEQAAKKLSAGWEAEIHLAVETIFPTWLLLGCLARLGAESPHTRVELIETVLGGGEDPRRAQGGHAQGAAPARGRRALRRAIPHFRRPRARRPRHFEAGGNHPRGGGGRVQEVRGPGERLRAKAGTQRS